ncbi:MAG: hypothetical protein ACN4GT_08685 [Gammaproteobacteria bacterium]
MSTIDNITVILGPPASQEQKDRLEAEAVAAGSSLDDTYVSRIAGIVEELTRRTDDAPSDLEKFFSELMGEDVTLRDTTPTFFEKKGRRYPAILVATADVVDMSGRSLQREVTEIFTRPETPAALAERIGTRLGLESAKTFYTFGPPV